MIDFTFFESPDAWDKPEAQAKPDQKETQVCFTKKYNKKYCLSKNYINAEVGNKRIQGYSVFHAAVTIVRYSDELIDHATDAEGNIRAV